MATLSISTEQKGPKRSEGFVKSIKSKTVEMMFLVAVVYCLLLPLFHSKVEANQYCSAQESSVSHYSAKAQFHESHENEKTIKDIQYAKGFYYADMNLEDTNFKTIAEYVKRIVFPFSVNIPGTKTILTILNLNITDECNYKDNETVCDICYAYVQNYTASCRVPEMECSNSSICNSSHLGMDEIGFYPENVTSLTLEVTAKGTFEINESFDRHPYNTSIFSMNLTRMLAISYSNMSGFKCVEVLPFRENGSTVEYKLTLKGETKSEHLMNHIRDAANLINQTPIRADISSFKMKTTGLVQMDISPNVYYDKPLTINCTIKDNVEDILWFIKGDNDLEEAIISKRHYNFKNGPVSTSILHINATSIWKGYYCCRFLFEKGVLIHEACQNSTIYLLPEEITAFPVAYTLRKPGLKLKKEVKCCITDDGENYNVTWKIENSDGVLSVSMLTGNFTKCSKYKIDKAFNRTTNYTCTFVNVVNQNRSEKIIVVVLDGNEKSCKAETENGEVWKITKAGHYAESIKSCEEQEIGRVVRFCKENGQWDKVFVNCTSKKLVALLDFSKELKEGRGSTSQKLPEVLRNISDILYLQNNSTANTNAFVHILGTLSFAASNSKSTFNSTVVSDFISIASNLTNQTKDATKIEFDSSELMRSVETFSEFYQPPEKEFSLLLQNILLKGKIFDANSSDDYFQSFPGNYTTEIASKNLQGSLINESLKISTIMYTNIDEFLPQNTEVIPEDFILSSQVQSTSLKMDNDKKRLNTELSIKMFFPPITSKKPNRDLKTARCVFWNYEKSSWSTDGCSTTVSKNGTYCTCNHLTPFSVLMSASKRIVPFLDEITYAGLTISIGSLLFFLTVEFVAWSTVVKSNVNHFRHITLINTAIALLFAQFFFLIGAINLVKKDHTLCMIVTIFTHLFFLSVFFWTLTQSLTLLYRLLFVFHHVRKSVFKLFSFFVGYICPLMIVIAATTAFISKGKYKRESICWLNATPSEEFTALHTFIIPVGCIIGINMLILTVVIVKLTRPSISEGMRNKEDKETMKKIIKAILILTPTFGLTWIVGFSLTENSHDIEHYVFVLLNSTQGLFILITSSVTENKVREAFIKRVKSMSSPTSSQTTFENVYSKTSNSVGK